VLIIETEVDERFALLSPTENGKHLSEMPNIRQLASISFVDEWFGDYAQTEVATYYFWIAYYIRYNPLGCCRHAVVVGLSHARRNTG
jgi:hypothetical protein